VAPSFAGALMQGVSLGIPIMIGAGMKIAYDLLLYGAFRKARSPEEIIKAGKNGPAPLNPPSARRDSVRSRTDCKPRANNGN